MKRGSLRKNGAGTPGGENCRPVRIKAESELGKDLADLPLNEQVCLLIQG